MTKRFIVESVMITNDCNEDKRIVKVITDKDELYSYNDLYEICDLVNEQQATIENYWKSRDEWRTKCHQTEEKLDYWKHKSLELYKLLRKINLSDMEWEEFLNIINEKELFDDE